MDKVEGIPITVLKEESNSWLDYNIFEYFTIKSFNKFSYNYNITNCGLKLII